jgi:uncharacterized protein (TIGR02145 family)
MKKIFYIFSLVFLVLSCATLMNCSKEEAKKNPPVIEFAANKTTAFAFDTITFTESCGNNPDAFHWEFPGGQPSGTWLRRPKVIYDHFGKYNVSLTAYNMDGNVIATKPAYITINYRTSTMTDTRDSKTYKTMLLKDQTWMIQNLDYTTPTGSVYYNNDNSNAATYGRLYTWAAATVACPPGWRLPFDGDWNLLVQYINAGDATLAGGFLKEEDTTHWASPNSGDDQAVGFDALPGGLRSTTDIFSGKSTDGYYWTATPTGGYSDISAFYRHFNNNSKKIIKDYMDKPAAMSVRCIKE